MPGGSGPSPVHSWARLPQSKGFRAMNQPLHFLQGGGPAGALLRGHAWDATPLGPPAGWPEALKTLVAIMLGSNQPMHICWGPGRTLVYNSAYTTVLGSKHPAALGRDFLEVWGEIRGELEPLVERTYGGDAVHMDDIHLVLQRNGHPEDTHFSFFFSPVRNGDGAVQGFFCACNETTTQVEAERAAAAAAERVQLALDAGAIIGTWVWDVPNDHFIADARFARSFGLSEQQCRAGLRLEQVMESIHPDDIPRVQQAVSAAMARGGPYRCEYRVRQHDGDWHWIEANGRVEMDAAGAPVRFPGVLLDIGERRRAEAERDQANALLRTFFEAVPGVVYAKDREGRLLMGNRGTSELLGLPPEAYVGRTDAELLSDQAQAARVMANDRRIMESGAMEQLEEEVHVAGGRPAWWHSTKMPLRDASGAVIGLIGSSVDITERKRQQEENARLYLEAQRAAVERTQLLESERAARGEAERASRVKDEFLATLSHELRTPLSAILGWVHVLRRKAAGDPSLQKGVDVIERSARAQTQLIEDLLDMSRITSGKMALDLRPLAPLEFVEAAVETLRPGAAVAGVVIDVLADEEVPTVMADPTRLQQVVWNLLTNAVKFSPRGGTVTVRLRSDAGWARIEVRDTGVGIKPEFLPHVFERFRQADGSTTRRFGGLGLGLAIVRNLVELHGGTIRADSEGEGRGACFTVRLPPQERGLAGEALRTLGAGATDLGGVKVLVVDDEPDVLELLARVLQDANAQVLFASSTDGAWKILQEQKPAVLVSDIGMPDADGYELVRRLRALAPEHGGVIPAIALTAFARAEDRQRALQSGFSVHLSKPVEPASLLANIAWLAEGGQPTRP